MKTKVAVVVLVAATTWGCLAGKQIAKGAIDVALAACIAEHPDDDEAALKEACKWADELAPLVKDLLSARQKGMAKHEAKMSAQHCAGDAGTTTADAGK